MGEKGVLIPAASTNSLDNPIVIVEVRRERDKNNA
jgi:hypothetical protein